MDRAACRYLTLQTCQEYADVLEYNNQMQDETLHIAISKLGETSIRYYSQTAKCALKHGQVEGCLHSH